MEKPKSENDTRTFKSQGVFVVASEAAHHSNLRTSVVRLDFYEKFIKAAFSVEDLKDAKKAVTEYLGDKTDPTNITIVQSILDDLIDFFIQHHNGTMSAQTKEFAMIHFDSMLNAHRTTGVINVPAVITRVRKRVDDTTLKFPSRQVTQIGIVSPYLTAQQTRPHNNVGREEPIAPTLPSGIAPPPKLQIPTYLKTNNEQNPEDAPDTQRDPEPSPEKNLALSELLQIAQVKLAKLRLLMNLIDDLEKIRTDLADIGIKTEPLSTDLHRSIKKIEDKISDQSTFPRSWVNKLYPMKTIQIGVSFQELQEKKTRLSRALRYEAADTTNFTRNFAEIIQILIDRVAQTADLPVQIKQQVDEIVKARPLLQLIAS